MPGVYDLWAPRRVSAASYIAYKTPSQHPDRVMREHDLVYFLEGEWEVFQDGVPYLLRAGDVLLLHGGRRHYSRRPCLAGTNTIYIHIFPAPGDAYLPPGSFSAPSPRTQAEGPRAQAEQTAQTERAGQTGGPPFLFPQEPSPGELPERIPCQGNEAVRLLFDALAKAFALETYKKEEKLSSLCQLLLRELYACAHNKIAGDLFSGAIGHMVSNSRKICSAQELAQAARVSERTLRNAFLSRYGLTPCEYQMRYKLRQAAAELLNNPQATIRAVAENLGFCDEFHFSKAFKKEFGTPPSVYRKHPETIKKPENAAQGKSPENDSPTPG